MRESVCASDSLPCPPFPLSRAFLDNVVDRMLVLKGDGLVRLFDGSYTEVRSPGLPERVPRLHQRRVWGVDHPPRLLLPSCSPHMCAEQYLQVVAEEEAEEAALAALAAEEAAEQAARQLSGAGASSSGNGATATARNGGNGATPSNGARRKRRQTCLLALPLHTPWRQRCTWRNVALPLAGSGAGAQQASGQQAQRNKGGGGKVAVAEAPKKAPAKRVISFYERQEYTKLCKRMAELEASKEALDAKVMALAQVRAVAGSLAAGHAGANWSARHRCYMRAQSGEDLAELERASIELGRVTDEIDAISERWLELAELAGDL